jgi:6-phosphogluconolactonase (cycloisomerase 2 family)
MWVLERDPASGMVRHLELVRHQDDRGIRGVQTIGVSPDSRYVFTASLGVNSLTVFRQDPGPGSLTRVRRIEEDAHTDQPACLVISPDGKYVYRSAYGEDGVVVYRWNAQREQPTQVELVKNGDIQQGRTVEWLRGVHFLSISSDGQTLYAACLRTGAVVVFGRDQASGQLTFIDALRTGQSGVQGMRSIESLALSPDGRNLYTADPRTNALAVFQRALVARQSVFLAPGGVQEVNVGCIPD